MGYSRALPKARRTSRSDRSPRPLPKMFSTSRPSPMRSASAPTTDSMAAPFNGELLRTAREFRNLNQKELAADLGVEPSTISRAENNITQPFDFLIEKIAERLNFPVEFFRQPDRIYGLPI